MDIVPKYEFRKNAQCHKGNHRVRKLSCWDQFISMCFGQLAFRHSHRDLTTTLNALDGRWGSQHDPIEYAFRSQCHPAMADVSGSCDGTHHNKGAIKMHTLMDLQGSIPVFIHIKAWPCFST